MQPVGQQFFPDFTLPLSPTTFPTDQPIWNGQVWVENPITTTSASPASQHPNMPTISSSSFSPTSSTLLMALKKTELFANSQSSSAINNPSFQPITKRKSRRKNPEEVNEEEITPQEGSISKKCRHDVHLKSLDAKISQLSKKLDLYADSQIEQSCKLHQFEEKLKKISTQQQTLEINLTKLTKLNLNMSLIFYNLLNNSLQRKPDSSTYKEGDYP